MLVAPPADFSTFHHSPVSVGLLGPAAAAIPSLQGQVGGTDLTPRICSHPFLGTSTSLADLHPPQVDLTAETQSSYVAQAGLELSILPFSSSHPREGLAGMCNPLSG